jgi:hypothetical protein
MKSFLGKSLIKLREKVDEFNSLLYIEIVMKVLASSLLLSVEFCLLADYFNDFNNYLYQIIVMVSFMICAAIDILGVCLSSQNVINSMESMIKATKHRIAFTYLSSEDYKIAKLILNMVKEIRFSASTLFVVKSTTVLMALSYVANYTVILIQTSDKI